MEAKADLSLEDGSSIDISAIEEKSNNISGGDEIDLNSDGENETVNGDSKPELTRSEPEDIFEDIPEPREQKSETVATSISAAEPTVAPERHQVRKHLLARFNSLLTFDSCICSKASPHSSVISLLI